MQGSGDRGADVLPLAKEYGGLQVDQAKRLKELEQENAKLKSIQASRAAISIVMSPDVRLDPRRTRQDAEPLFFVERDWKPAHAVQREPAVRAHFQSEATLVFALELGILSPQALQLGLHLRFTHRFPPPILFTHFILQASRRGAF
ncbi:hypothetical protein [Edaphobacter modestus]|uniref:hypothetical protein n=1 Tax=Edaphobacter modestus TaxID=388466 RepID=UPI001A929EA9